MVYAMSITETMSFDVYWNDPRFQDKKPSNSSNSGPACGDNIYYRDPTTNRLCQMTGSFHHACDMTRDIKADRVLISDDFIYWGGDGPPLPEFSDTSLVMKTQGYKCKFSEEVVEQFGKWLGGSIKKAYAAIRRIGKRRCSKTGRWQFGVSLSPAVELWIPAFAGMTDGGFRLPLPPGEGWGEGGSRPI